MKEGLYSLISDVLFVSDRDHPELYHPRICVQNDFIFKQLSGKEQEAFNHLYNHYYYQRHNEFWYQEAMKKLPVLTQSTPMLVCGEDLGMVPECVAWVMERLQILSLEIQRMPKAFGRSSAVSAITPSIPYALPEHTTCPHSGMVGRRSGSYRTLLPSGTGMLG